MQWAETRRPCELFNKSVKYMVKRQSCLLGRLEGHEVLRKCKSRRPVVTLGAARVTVAGSQQLGYAKSLDGAWRSRGLASWRLDF